jgi:hypothetical protein
MKEPEIAGGAVKVSPLARRSPRALAEEDPGLVAAAERARQDGIHV